MHHYLIQYKISTLAILNNRKFSHREYSFSSYQSDRAWIASKTVEAENADKALTLFFNELLPLVGQFSLLSQCAFRVTATSYFIYKIDQNNDKIILIHHVKPRPPIGIFFDDQEISQLVEVDKIDNIGGLFFLMESTNATTYYTRLIMLISAAEGLAGEIIKKGRTETNKDVLQNILGKDLHEKLFSYGSGLRNKLNHGAIKSHLTYSGLIDEIYGRILNYLKAKYGIKFSQNVIFPQRNFYENYQYITRFMQFDNEPLFDLERIEAVLDTVEESKLFTSRCIEELAELY